MESNFRIHRSTYSIHKHIASVSNAWSTQRSSVEVLAEHVSIEHETEVLETQYGKSNGHKISNIYVYDDICKWFKRYRFDKHTHTNGHSTPSCRTTTSSQHARPSGVRRRRSDGLECAAWRPPRPVAQCRQFPEEAKDASVSECTWTLSALEALHNALYKFKTYLLTYCRKYTTFQSIRKYLTCPE